MRAIRKFSLTLAATAILLLLAVALTSVGAGSRFAQSSQQNPSASALPGAQTGSGSAMSMPATPMALVAPLFIEDTESTSTITMVNSIPAPLDVDVILSDLHGNELARHTTTIGANAAQQVMVRSLLDEASYAGSAYGSAVLVPHRMFPLAAQMSIVRGIGVPNDIEEEFLMLMEEPAPSSFRAVASDIEAAPVIAARSLSATKQPISVECMEDTGQRRTSNLSIQPNETLLVQACLDGGANPIPYLDDSTLMADAHHGSVAISVSSPAPPKELVVFGLGIQAKDPVRMRAMTFTDINALRSSTAIYPGVVAEGSLLGLRKPRLKLSIANFGHSPRNATFYLTAGSGDTSRQQPVATVNIPPDSVAVRNLDPEASSDAFTLDRSLVVQTDAAIGEVLSDVQLLSSSPELPLSVPLPWKDEAQPYNGAQHPWRIDGPFSSTVLLFNPDQHEANSVALSIFAGDKRWNKLISLPALATVAVRLNDVVAKQEPDEKGRTLPRTSTSGIVSWFTLRNPKIFGQLVQANATERIARPFACPNVTILCGVTIDDLNVTVNQQGSAQAHTITCGSCAPCSCTLGGCNVIDGNPDNGPVDFSSWGADNTSIASLASSSSSSATFQGASPGTTNSHVAGTDGNGCTARGTGAITVTPALNSISPARGPVSGTTSVTLNGNGFGSNCSGVTISAGSNITATCNSVNNTQIQASFAISSSASGGNQSVSVTVNGQTSPSVNFYVQIPAKLVFFNTGCAPNGQGGLQNIVNGNVVDCGGVTRATNFCGVNRNLTYQLVDQSASQSPFPLAYSLSESFSNLSTTNPALGLPTPSQNVPIPANGTVTDAQFVGFTYPTCLGSNDHHSYNQNFSVSVGGVIYNLSTTVSISNGNFNGTPEDNISITIP